MELADTSAWVVSRRAGAEAAGEDFDERIVRAQIAVAAETAGAAVLHYDEDYERIARITGQPTRWLVPRGTL